VATNQCPPQEELEFQLAKGKYPAAPLLARPADIISKWLNDHVYEDTRRALRVTLDSPFGLDVVYQESEYGDPLTREGLLTGAMGPLDEWHALTMDSDGRLRVDAKISLSTTELEVNLDATDGDTVGIYGFTDGNPGSPAPINIDSSGAIRVSTSPSIDAFVLYNEALLDNAGEHIIVTYTVPTSANFSLFGIDASGHCDAWYRLKINNNIIGTRRNNWCERNIEFKYSHGLPLSPGDTITLTVKHNQLTSISFNATIYGEEV